MMIKQVYHFYNLKQRLLFSLLLAHFQNINNIKANIMPVLSATGSPTCMMNSGTENLGNQNLLKE